MARISSHQHLKPQVFESFHNGGTPNRIIAQFGIPKSTAYDWYKEFKASLDNPITKPPDSGINLVIPELPKAQKKIPEKNTHVTVVTPEVIEDETDQIADKKSDFDLIRDQLRSLTDPARWGGGVAVQACACLMKLMQLQQDLPKHLIDGKEQQTIDEVRKEVADMDAEELSRMLKELTDAS